jgi:hypothetical protein
MLGSEAGTIEFQQLQWSASLSWKCENDDDDDENGHKLANAL